MQPRTRHPLLTLLLALALCLSGLAQGHAAAGAPVGAMAVVICADGPARSILIDANGAPVEPEQGGTHGLCPDCVLAKVGALTAGIRLPAQRLARSRAAPRPILRLRPRRRPQAAQPRGPPTKA